jgi:hypothetical protein
MPWRLSAASDRGIAQAQTLATQRGFADLLCFGVSDGLPTSGVVEYVSKSSRVKVICETMASAWLSGQTAGTDFSDDNSGTGEQMTEVIKPANYLCSRFKAPLWGLVCFIAGTISGPFIQEQFVALLPGPLIKATLRAERMTIPGRSSCNFYRFNFYTSEPLDYMYLKIQFPNPISGFKVGSPS